MYPLFLCSVLAVAVAVERLTWGPSRRRVIPPDLEDEMRRLLAAGRYDELTGLCRASKSPLARIILTVLRNSHKPRPEVIDAVQIVGKREAMELQRYLSVLATIAAISPLLGLLGTVFGMIATFTVIETMGVGNAPALAGGISEALITTAAGLTIAIPTLVFHRYLLQKTKMLVVEMETLAAEVLDSLTTAKREAGEGSGTPGVLAAGKPVVTESHDIQRRRGDSL